MIESIELNENAGSLLLTSNRGRKSLLSAATLRRNAKDASSRRARLDTGEVSVADDITITALHPMGSTGLNIQFSDGHKRAIFPYPYLSTLAFPADN